MIKSRLPFALVGLLVLSSATHAEPLWDAFVVVSAIESQERPGRFLTCPTGQHFVRAASAGTYTGRCYVGDMLPTPAGYPVELTLQELLAKEVPARNGEAPEAIGVLPVTGYSSGKSPTLEVKKGQITILYKRSRQQ